MTNMILIIATMVVATASAMKPTCNVETGPKVGNCPVPRCTQPAKGCRFVTRYVQSDTGTCCPELCHTECATSDTGDDESQNFGPRCTCPYGKKWADCDYLYENGQEVRNKCETCNNGFVRKSDGSRCLQRRQCECNNGNPSSDQQCHEENKHACSTCECGFQLNTATSKCDAWMGSAGASSPPNCDTSVSCSCAGGTPANSGCTPKSMRKCASCDNGWTKSSDSTRCVQNQACTCENGTPHSDGCGGQTNNNNCRKCNNGYQLTTTGSCNVVTVDCACSNGRPGGSCTARSSHKCQSCFEGATLRQDSTTGQSYCEIAEKFDCLCPGGIPAIEMCSARNTPKCDECRQTHEINTERTKCTKRNIQCTCENGTPHADGCDEQTNTNYCQKCNTGYEMTSTGQCSKIPPPRSCMCSHGTPGTGCQHVHQQKCASCSRNFFLRGEACIQKQACTCPNGSPDSAGCMESSSVSKCTSCKIGFRLSADGERCDSNCVCRNGEPDRNGCANEKDLTRCSSCNAGHEINNGQCEPRCDWKDHDIMSCAYGNRCQWNSGSSTCGEKLLSCQCPNGTPFTNNGQPGCPNTRSIMDKLKCTECNPGYTLNRDGTRCEQDQMCMCENGTPAAGAVKCFGYDRRSCASCNTGYTRSADNKYCVKDRACTCRNGTPDSAGCTGKLSTQRCTACNDKFQLNDFNWCELSAVDDHACMCSNGEPHSTCPKDMKDHCASCKDGFRLNDGSCESECTCRSGFADPQTGCPGASKEKCSACTPGYTLEATTNTCKEDKRQCKCTGGTPNPDGCDGDTIEKCSKCNAGWTMNTLKNTCEPPCMTTKEIRRVCCDGKDYINPSTASCDGCTNFKSGLCKQQCTTIESFATCAASGCSWTAISANSPPQCEDKRFTKPPAVQTAEKCKDDACQVFGDDYDYNKYYTALGDCSVDDAPSVDDNEIQSLRRKCAVQKDKRSGDVYRAMMGYGSGNGEKEETGEDKVQTSQQQMGEAQQAMAESCYNCMNEENAVATTCEAAAKEIFKSTFDDDFANAPNKPSDFEISRFVARAGNEHASRMRRDNCQSITTMPMLERRKCYENFPANAALASCRSRPNMDATDKETAKEEETKTVVADVDCKGKNAAECYQTKKDAYKEVTGKSDATDAEVKTQMDNVASEKAADVMDSCVRLLMKFDQVDITDEAIKIARQGCLEQSKDEYIKHNPVDRDELQDTVMNSKLTDEATKRAGEILKNGGTMEDAKKEQTRLTGKKDNEMSDTDLKTELAKSAAVEAAKKMHACRSAKSAGSASTNDDCLQKYKDEYAKRTNTKASDVNNDMIKEGQAKREKEAMGKALATVNKEKNQCTEAATICMQKERESKKKEMKRVTGKDVNDIDVERIQQKVIQDQMYKLRMQCIRQKTSPAECMATIKEKTQQLSGRAMTDDEADYEAQREQQDADDRILAETAKTLGDDDTKTSDQKKAERLATLKNIKNGQTLTDAQWDDALDRADKRLSEKEIANFLDDVVDDSEVSESTFAVKKAERDAAIKTKLEKMRGSTFTNKEVQDVRRKAENANAAKELVAAMRAGATKAETKSRFEQSLKKQGAYSKDHRFDPLEFAQRQKEAKDALVKDVIDTEIDTSTDEKRKKGKALQTALTQDRLKAAYGGAPKKWEARTEIERAAKNKLYNLQKATMMKAGASDRSEADKKIANDALIDTYKKATGESNVQLYQIKQKIKDAAVHSKEVREAVEQATTETAKKLALKEKMTAMTGETPDDIEVSKLVKQATTEKMLETAKLRARAFDRTRATVAQKKAEMTKRRKAMQEDYEKTTGRTFKFKSEIKKSYNDVLTKEAGTVYRECVKSGEISKSECLIETQTKLSVMDEEEVMDGVDIAVKVQEGEKLAAVDRAKECQKLKTKIECRHAVQKFIQESRGETKDIPDYQASRTLKEGAEKGLGRIIADCRKADDQTQCKSNAFQDFKDKTLDDTVTEEEFEMNIKKAAAKETLDTVENCDSENEDEDCTQVLLDTYKRTRGKGNSIKKAQAVAAVKDILSDSIVQASISCREQKSVKECMKIIKKKIRKSKTWKKKKPTTATGTKAEGTKPDTDNTAVVEEEKDDIAETVEVEREQKRGAVQYAKKTFKACHNLAKELDSATHPTERQLKNTECQNAFETDYKKAYPAAATSRPVMLKAKKDAQINVARSKLEAMSDAMEEFRSKGETYVDKTKEEIMTLLLDAIKDGAPVEDITKFDRPMEQEDILNKAGLEKVRAAARACKELGEDQCLIIKTIKDKERRLADAEDNDNKGISLAEEMFKGDGRSLMGKTPTKQDVQEVTRIAAKTEVFDGVRDCMRVGTKDTQWVKGEMDKCLKDAEDTALLIHGDTKNKENDREDAFNNDGISEMDACAAAAGHTTWFCRTVMEERIKRTCGKKLTEEDTELALTKKSASEMNQKDKVYASTPVAEADVDQVRTKDRKREKDARDSMKRNLERRGLKPRKVVLVLQKAAVLRTLRKGADALKAGKTDVEVETILKSEFDKNPDAPDLTEEKKKKMMKNCKAIVAGGRKGNLKFKKTGKLALSVCHTSLAATTSTKVTRDTIIDLIKSNAKASDVINTEASSITTFKTPKQDTVTKRTCGTIHVEPKKGKTMKEAKEKLDQIMMTTVRRALRQEIGRKLNDDEYSTSSGEVEDIVPGDTTTTTTTDDEKSGDDKVDNGNKNTDKDDKDDKDDKTAGDDAADGSSTTGGDSVGMGALVGAAVGCLVVGVIAGALVVHMKSRSNAAEPHNVLKAPEVEMADHRIFERRGSKTSNNPLAVAHTNPMRN